MCRALRAPFRSGSITFRRRSRAITCHPMRSSRLTEHVLLSAFWSGVADARPFFALGPARRETRVANAGAAEAVTEANNAARVMLTVRVARDERFQNCT